MTEPMTFDPFAHLRAKTRQTARQYVLQIRALGWELNRFSSEEIGGELHFTLFFGPNDEAVVDLTVPKKPPP